MRWVYICAAALAFCAGCQTTRTYDITATPPDATLKVDGVEKGRGHVVVPITYTRGTTHTVSAERPGFKEQSVTLSADSTDPQINIDLKPLSRKVNVTVAPVGGIVKINGNPVSADFITQTSPELEFTLDAANRWNVYAVTAERPGFTTATAQVTWDGGRDYALTLEPAKRDVTITTTPPGANVFLDDDAHPLGASPATASLSFDFDEPNNKWLPRKIIAIKAGWEPTTQPVTFEDAQAEVHMDLLAKSKVVRITTDPPGGTVTIAGKALPRDAEGVSYGKLQYPPVDDKGALPVYTATAVKKTEQSEWEPREIPLAWENGKTSYDVTLKEVTTRPMPTLAVGLERNKDGGWDVAPQEFTTIAKKSVAEGAGGTQPVQLYAAPAGVTIDTLTVSPDGSTVLFTLLSTSRDKSDFRSVIMAKRADGSGETQQISDGNSLDVMPSYTPNGDEIVFSSNRSGRTLTVWERSVAGVGGLVALANNRNEEDLWPTLDADPRPHLFYEALFDGQPDGHLYMATLNTTIRSELTGVGVSEPRVSPKADSVAFVSVNEKTGKREVYRMPISGGSPEVMVSTLDADNYDPAWNRDGSKLAFVSDRGVDEDRRHNPDVWVLDLTRRAEPIQVTTNGSVDDCPVWDPQGNSIYFRSNRGGAWGIWKVPVR